MSYFFIIAGILSCWFFQNLIHEGSHVLFSYVFCDYKPIDIIPWPHKHKNRWVFSRAEYIPTYPRSDKEYLVHISPIIINIPYLLFCLAMAITLNPYFYIPLVIASIDVIVWLYSFFFGSEYSDGKRFRSCILKKNVTN